MGVAIFDLLQEHGANWVNCTGDFTKKVSSDGVQIFVTLSPDGTELVSCICSKGSNVIFYVDHLCNLPSGLTISDNISRNVVVAKMQLRYPWLKSENVFEIKSRNGRRIVFTYIHSYKTLVIYGILDGKDHFIEG